MKKADSLKMYASLAKSRLLNSKDIPFIIGKIPHKYIDVMEKSIGNIDIFYKICRLVENGEDVTSLISIVDRDIFEAMLPTERQRYVLRLAEVFCKMKKLYAEFSGEIMCG